MKKWLIIGLIVAAIAVAAWWYFKSKKAKDKKDRKEEGDGSSGEIKSGEMKRSSIGADKANAVTRDKPLNTAGPSTVVEAQKILNKGIEAGDKMGFLVPKPVETDGKLGAKTIQALKDLVAATESVKAQRIILAKDIKQDVTKLTLAEVNKMVDDLLKSAATYRVKEALW